MNRLQLFLALLTAFLSINVVAQTCDTSKTASTPASRFQDNGDGTLTDSKTGKVWLRCALGAQWNGSSCENLTSTYSYRQARSALDELNDQKQAGRNNWRLPTADELAGIVETRCFKPAVNLDVFSYSPESGFWTGDTEQGAVSRRAWIVHFLHGGRYIANQSQSWRVRPVADR